jgi:cysteine synthase A
MRVQSGAGMKNGVLSCIGGTPLIEMVRLFRDQEIRLFAKMEQLNPGGSTKDRPALLMIQHGLETGEIRSDTVVIESSSGNMGIGLAQACAYYNLRFICVVDPKTTRQNIGLIRAYNAEVEMVEEPDPETGEFLAARIKRVRKLKESFPDCFWVNQYASQWNSSAHHQTMHEIVSELEGKFDYLFCATSTCGTLRGCAEYKRLYRLPTQIIAVDAVGSVIFGGNKAARLIPGHGAASVPDLYQDDLADEFIKVTDLECVVGCHRLVQEEAIMAGGSSGAVVMAIEHFLPRLRPGAVCVALLPDRGERYLDTVYSPDWVKDHFGEVSYLWKARGEVQMMASATF